MSFETQTFRTEPNKCPSCSKTLNACTNTSGSSEPEPGDFTLCLYCAAICCFTESLSLRLATPTDLRELDFKQPEMLGLLLRTKEEVERFKAEREKAENAKHFS